MRLSLEEYGGEDLAALRAGQVYVVEDILKLATLPATVRALQDDGARSYVRVPLVVRAGEHLFPALSVQLVRAHRGGANLTATLTPYEMESLVLGGRPLPVNGLGQVWVNFVGPPHTIPHHSAAAVLAGRVPAGALRGKIVLVGFTASGFDDVSTPFAPVARISLSAGG